MALLTRPRPTDYFDFLLPKTIRENWQMNNSERLALAGVLASVKPRLALEIGVYYGGSTSLISQYANKLLAVDIDPAVKTRFSKPSNVDFHIGDSWMLINTILSDVMRHRKPLEFILLDADHSYEGVRRDINALLQIVPSVPMVLLMHDTANPGCRAGVLAADWASNPYVYTVDLDFVPGVIIEHTVSSGSPECWGGMGMAFFAPERRTHDLVLSQSAATSISTLHRSISTGFWRG